MKTHVPALALLLLLTGPTVLLSQEKPKESPPPAVAATPPTDDNPPLKQISFHGTRLSEAISYLRDACPRFKVVVVPDPQCADPDPTLPDIELKNIDLNQFLDVLSQSLPQLSVDGVQGEKGPVCLMKIGAQAGAQPPRLQVYRLTPLIPESADRKTYLNDILSLVQAALEAQGSANNVLMKVHEQTGTLIFRGNAAQTDVVEHALKALEPTNSESQRAKLQLQYQAERERMQAKVDQLEERLKEAEMVAAVARKQAREQMNEIENLRARLKVQDDQNRTYKKP